MDREAPPQLTLDEMQASLDRGIAGVTAVAVVVAFLLGRFPNRAK